MLKGESMAPTAGESRPGLISGGDQFQEQEAALDRLKPFIDDARTVLSDLVIRHITIREAKVIGILVEEGGQDVRLLLKLGEGKGTIYFATGAHVDKGKVLVNEYEAEAPKGKKSHEWRVLRTGPSATNNHLLPFTEKLPVSGIVDRTDDNQRMLVFKEQVLGALKASSPIFETDNHGLSALAEEVSKRFHAVHFVDSENPVQKT